MRKILLVILAGFLVALGSAVAPIQGQSLAESNSSANKISAVIHQAPRRLTRRFFIQPTLRQQQRYIVERMLRRIPKRVYYPPVNPRKVTTKTEPVVTPIPTIPQPQVPTAPNPRVPTIHPALNKASIKAKDRQIANQILSALPAKCQGTLKNFYVRYNPGQTRALGGASTMIISGLIASEMTAQEVRGGRVQANLGYKSSALQQSLVADRLEWIALFIHEFGHLTDLGCIKGTAASGPSEFKDGETIMYQNDPSVEFYRISWRNEKTQKAGAKATDFATGYAATNAFEDFSEAWTMYVLHRPGFERRAQDNAAMAAKLAWFKKYLPEQPLLATSTYTGEGNLPWDATKLEFAWHPKSEVTAMK